MVIMRTSCLRLLSLLILGVCSWSCASYTDETRDMNLAFHAGQFESALAHLDKSGIKEEDRNRLLYNLERGSILDKLDRRAESRQLFLKADAIVDQLYTKSLSKEAATYLYNEGAQAYSGEDYEKVAIHTILAHSFLDDSKINEARVEAARINTRLAEINSFYDENKNKYKEDAYARYLAGIVYEALGEFDDAIVDYKAALRVYEDDYAKYFDTKAPRQLIEALHSLLNKRGRRDEAKQLRENYDFLKKLPERKGMTAEIIVIHELGAVAQKERSEFVYPIGGQIVRFSFPVIRKKPLFFGKTSLKISNGDEAFAELAQNFDAIASQNLEDRRLRLMAKSAARLILKGQITQKAEKEFGPLGFIAASIYGAVTETADTRSWTLLPAAVSVSRLAVKPGSYDVEISSNGKVSAVKKLTLKADQILILRDD